MMIHAG